MTLLVPQRSDHDCVICSVAMLTHRSYEDVVEAAGASFDPEKGVWNAAGVVTKLGFSHTYDNGEAVGDIVSLARQFSISPEFFRSLAWGRRALISVPSLNNPGGLHMVFYDGAELFDPSTRRRYEKFADLKPDELILFREHGRSRPA